MKKFNRFATVAFSMLALSSVLSCDEENTGADIWPIVDDKMTFATRTVTVTDSPTPNVEIPAIQVNLHAKAGTVITIDGESLPVAILPAMLDFSLASGVGAQILGVEYIKLFASTNRIEYKYVAPAVDGQPSTSVMFPNMFQGYLPNYNDAVKVRRHGSALLGRMHITISKEFIRLMMGNADVAPPVLEQIITMVGDKELSQINPAFVLHYTRNAATGITVITLDKAFFTAALGMYDGLKDNIHISPTIHSILSQLYVIVKDAATTQMSIDFSFKPLAM